jgi:hypothetical protein
VLKKKKIKKREGAFARQVAARNPGGVEHSGKKNYKIKTKFKILT